MIYIPSLNLQERKPTKMNKRCMGCMEQYDSGLEICPYCGYVEGTGAEEAIHMAPGSILLDRYIIGRVLGLSLIHI